MKAIGMKTKRESMGDSGGTIEEHMTKSSGEVVVRRYLKGKLLGKGGFAKCFEVTNSETKKVSAAKIVLKSSLTKNRAKQKLMSEIKIHRSLRHQSVVAFEHFFEDAENVYILLEICANQTLNELVRRRKKLSELEAQCYIQQLIAGLQYLHAHRVIHRDLKLGNLFLTDKMELKIGDFGLATKLEFDGERKRTICGTPNYIAPEILEGRQGHSYEVDIWSLGVILYTMLVGKPPFETQDVQTTYKRIKMNIYTFPESACISDPAKNLIQRILSSDPSRRPKLEDILAHPFLSAHKIPSFLPASTLACPPSAAYVRQFTGSEAPVLPAMKLESTAPCKENLELKAAVKDRLGTLSTERGLLSRPESKHVSGQPLASARAPFTANAATSVPTTAAACTTGASGTGMTGTVGTAGTMATAGSQSKRVALGDRPENFPRPPSVSVPVGHSKREGEGPAQQAKTGADKRVNNAADGDIVGPVKGPDVWVKKWVDYSSKYGLGYLLSNGATGVFFNDSTKIVLDPNGYHFEYLEKQGPDRLDLVHHHTLTDYPKALQKKVTLLQHFRSYLEGDSAPSSTNAVPAKKLESAIYAKKWLRTRHAIMFRLSNKVVQVNFQDSTEIILSSESKVVTYVNKAGERMSYPLNSALESTNAEMSKRLKYTKEILTRMLNQNAAPKSRPASKDQPHVSSAPRVEGC